jgi:hypothetical protein
VWYLNQRGEEVCAILNADGTMLGSVQLSMVHCDPITLIRAK